ncbi:M61 family metallopeptidase [Rubrivivax gelatinosus]|uniref:Putative metalloprotease with PDZ domain n=1 Tax=Rubrivivax gelatinosus TaxID=28068 RepID=A0A4R2M842_RUBGE|nr:PDZ domain-containing protein [Rubrivivax gelatinosus]MBK1689336.1 peptidase M61 [Rubrivivax gelatinosus]TCP02490.1 putative metalloprotease with PDZ domain [Rubrivivax gelatinosus]
MPRYRIEFADLNAHLFRVTLTLPRPAAAQRLALPAWIPGSYMIRDFARHLVGLQARQGERELVLEPLDKTSWLARCDGAEALVVTATVYANDPSVRGAFLDGTRGFFNGTSGLLRAEGREHEPHLIELGPLPAGWEVATAMPAAGRRRWQAADYDEAIDHPFAFGRFWRGRFEVAGAEHEIAVDGAWPSFDGERLLADIERICRWQIRFWHGVRGKPPFSRYLFLLHAAEDAYGGLEHRASTALIASRRDLPRRGEAEPGDAYVGLLGLFSHEYFHTWNVKRLRPRALVGADLGREAPTSLLWFFEGFTSYYDDLSLLRTGQITRDRYLALLGKQFAGVLATPGRQVQSVAQAAADAWTRYYRADENTPNATVSYYAKGALVALLVDLRRRAAGSSLDEAMRRLWKRHAERPVDEADLVAALADGVPGLAEELADWVHGTGELPVAEALAGFGVATQLGAGTLAQRLGLRLAEGASGSVVRQVLRGSAAEAAGLAPGDELLAAGGWRLRRLEDVLQWLPADAPFELLVARDQRLHRLRLVPGAAASPTVSLAADTSAPAVALARRKDWLGG